MATHCSILAWKIPWTEEPVGGGGGAANGKQSDTTERLHVPFLFQSAKTAPSAAPDIQLHFQVTLPETKDSCY